MERRAHPRSVLTLTVRMATANERAAPAVEVINASDGGLLIACHEPMGLVVDERLVISSSPTRGHAIHVLGRVARVAHGTDFRTYVAVRFDPEQTEEIDQLLRGRRCRTHRCECE